MLKGPKILDIAIILWENNMFAVFFVCFKSSLRDFIYLFIYLFILASTRRLYNSFKPLLKTRDQSWKLVKS